MKPAPGNAVNLKTSTMGIKGPAATLGDNEFARLFEELGATKTAQRLGMSIRGVHSFRKELENRLRRQIVSPNKYGRASIRVGIEHPGRIELQMPDGVVLVGSDCHYWPGEPSLMHRAFVRFCEEFKPKIVVLNGDVIDACSISRHPPIGWERRPTVEEEIRTAQERLHEIEKAASRAQKIWPLGNHDGRFETRLATVAPEFAKVHGVHLRDHFSLWEPCWSLFINSNVVIKHRFKGGIHATHNNALWAGRSVITGHLHSAKVTPLTDYNGVRYGVDTGCIADPNHRAFLDYTEDNPKNWRDGFAVLTFSGGQLLPPELVHRWGDNEIVFRGEITKV